MKASKKEFATSILDVTLRDGGYKNNWDFTQENATAIVSGLYDAGIEHIEIGYRNGPPGHSGYGLSGETPNDYITTLRKEVPNAKLSVMYSPSTVTEKGLEELASLGVAMVRCSIPMGSLEQALPLVKKGRDLGMISAGNITTATEYQPQALIDACNKVVDNGCSVVYIADSNGSMTPESVRRTFVLLHDKVQSTPWGFHNHNQLGMAMANAIEAMKMGVSYIDSSLRGMGRSSGNVPTESLVTYLNRTGNNQRLKLPDVLRVARYLLLEFNTASPNPGLKDMAMGAYDFLSFIEAYITTAANEYDISWYSLIEKMAASNLDKTALTLDDVRAIARSMT